MKRLLALLLAVGLLFSFTIDSAAYTAAYQKNSEAKKKVALTFDDGPHPIITGRILDILEKYGIKATFFVIGKNVENYPDAFLQIVRSECEIGNHTYSHRNIGKMSPSQIKSEILLTEEAISRYTKRRTSVLRPPEGSFGESVMAVSEEEGYDIILWSIDTLDWAHTSAEEITERVFSRLGDGDIILMHDYTSGGAHTCEALELMIPRMIDMGYEFVTVSELVCVE